MRNGRVLGAVSPAAALVTQISPARDDDDERMEEREAVEEREVLLHGAGVTGGVIVAIHGRVPGHPEVAPIDSTPRDRPVVDRMAQSGKIAGVGAVTDS